MKTRKNRGKREKLKLWSLNKGVMTSHPFSEKEESSQAGLMEFMAHTNKHLENTSGPGKVQDGDKGILYRGSPLEA